MRPNHCSGIRSAGFRSKGEQLVGIITTSDIMKAFLDLMGASEQASVRVDFILEGEEHGLVGASRLVSREGGEILGVCITLSFAPLCTESRSTSWIMRS